MSYYYYTNKCENNDNVITLITRAVKQNAFNPL